MCSNVWPSTRLLSDRFQISLLGYTLRFIFMPLVANVLMSWQLHRHDQAAHFVFLFFSPRIFPRISSYQIICTLLGQYNRRVEAMHLAIESVEYLWYFWRGQEVPVCWNVWLAELPADNISVFRGPCERHHISHPFCFTSSSGMWRSPSMRYLTRIYMKESIRLLHRGLLKTWIDFSQNLGLKATRKTDVSSPSACFRWNPRFTFCWYIRIMTKCLQSKFHQEKVYVLNNSWRAATRSTPRPKPCACTFQA